MQTYLYAAYANFRKCMCVCKLSHYPSDTSILLKPVRKWISSALDGFNGFIHTQKKTESLVVFPRKQPYRPHDWHAHRRVRVRTWQAVNLHVNAFDWECYPANDTYASSHTTPHRRGTWMGVGHRRRDVMRPWTWFGCTSERVSVRDLHADDDSRIGVCTCAVHLPLLFAFLHEYDYLSFQQRHFSFVLEPGIQLMLLLCSVIRRSRSNNESPPVGVIRQHLDVDAVFQSDRIRTLPFCRHQIRRYDITQSNHTNSFNIFMKNS